MAITSRDDLKDYALRSLGAPVIQINVDDDQLEDRIDDALAMFWEYHVDGTERIFAKHELTQEDIDNQYITLPNNITNVLRVLPTGGILGNTSNLQYVMYISDILNYRRFMTEGINGYAISMSYMNLIQDMFNTEKNVQFNVHKNRLYIQTSWSNMKPGMFLLVECYSIIDPTEFNETWNNRWLKKYVTALFKRQWGSNLTKYTGAQLSGGIGINGEKIYDDAVNEIKELEEELQNSYQDPVDFFMG